MRKFVSSQLALRLGAGALLAAVVGLVYLGGRDAQAQDPRADPLFGSKTLKAGFAPDPFTVKVTAGGTIKTSNGGVTAYVSRAPDFRLTYTAGDHPLTFRVSAKEDTTLLILTPEGTWIADDDGGGFPNPKVHIAKPRSGTYDIWVGTVKEGITPGGVLSITELK